MPTRVFDQIKANAVPVELMRTAAKGALPLAPVEMLEILVYLSTHPLFGQEAQKTLAHWDLVSAVEVAADPNAPPDVLGYFWLDCNRRPALIPALLENPAISEDLLVEAAANGRRETINHLLNSPRARSSVHVVAALRENPNLGPEQVRELDGEPAPQQAAYNDNDSEFETAFRLWHDTNLAEITAEQGKPFELLGEDEDQPQSEGEQPSAEIASDPAKTEVDRSTALAVAGMGVSRTRQAHRPEDEKKFSLLQKIGKMNAGERVKLAFSGGREERMILIRDGASIVRRSVLASPKLTEPDLEMFAAAKNVHESVLREIARTRRFLKNYHVVRNLVCNPKCPLDISLTLVKNLLVYDLKGLRFNKGVPDTIRQVAGQLYREKTGPARELGRKQH